MNITITVLGGIMFLTTFGSVLYNRLANIIGL